MKQSKQSVTEYWNEFRLVAREAELDDSTGGELLLEGMIAELQKPGELPAKNTRTSKP